ncbi:amino acid permease [Vibrio marisflavi]|uniref:Lysine-specific permease n=1 Tax=Vibrio marisflavi CECT 7928 TaxID=634439 RepID=A0ABM9A679_9VIBR|nr:amino acid permease [Vibrio marisflavi]CAH0540721.1 Lysine-specific permease [Vibrio marisflavi CECT 7928]
MIALGGSIGTGIFLASGYAISVAGPGGAIAAYSLIAIMVFFLITSLGEMATHSPTTGSFCQYSTDYVNPSFGFAIGYTYWFNWAITIAAEISAATIIVKFWFPEAPALLVSGLFFALILGVNLFSVKVFGESEYIMSLLKVSVIIIFIVLGACLVLTQPHLGLKNFTIADGPFHNGFSGFVHVFLIAGFSFQGCELIGISAGETKDPEKNIPKAVRTVFWRLLLFYILSTLLISLLIPFNDPSLAHGSSVESSPFTLVFQHYFNTGIATNLLNLIVLVAVISAANASMYSSTRTLWYMGENGQAPKLFAKTTSFGLPVYALVVTAIVGSAVFLSSFTGTGELFTILLNVSALCGFIAWFSIALSHYCFRKKELKGDTSKLKYTAKMFPYAPIISMIFITLIIAGQAFEMQLTTFNVLTKYGALIAFFAIMLGHRIWSKKSESFVQLKPEPYQ